LAVIQARSLRLGRDLSLVCRDDVPLGRFFETPVSIVMRNTDLIGHTAAQLFWNRSQSRSCRRGRSYFPHGSSRARVVARRNERNSGRSIPDSYVDTRACLILVVLRLIAPAKSSIRQYVPLWAVRARGSIQSPATLLAIVYALPLKMSYWLIQVNLYLCDRPASLNGGRFLVGMPDHDGLQGHREIG
jgi:hypothetical protein